MEVEGQLYIEEFLENIGNRLRAHDEELKARLSKYIDLTTNEIIVDHLTEPELAEMFYLLKELGYGAHERTPILRRVLQKNSAYEKQNK